MIKKKAASRTHLRRKVEKMDKGVYIVKMKNGNTRKVVNK